VVQLWIRKTGEISGLASSIGHHWLHGDFAPGIGHLFDRPTRKRRWQARHRKALNRQRNPRKRSAGVGRLYQTSLLPHARHRIFESAWSFSGIKPQCSLIHPSSNRPDAPSQWKTGVEEPKPLAMLRFVPGSASCTKHFRPSKSAGIALRAGLDLVIDHWGADIGRSARRRQRITLPGLQGQGADPEVYRIDPGVVSLVAELRGHGS
jgi:hypothetical protein